MKKRIIIGITDCSKYNNYEGWVKGHGVDVIRLSQHENNSHDVEKCHGIILSGGEDVHPRLYKKDEYVELCDEIDETRDEFEWRVLEYTEKNKLPLLGICRGLQMVNVFFGGTLIPHIPAFGKFDHSRTESTDRYHEIRVDPNSQLSKIVGTSSGEVNSAHHQGAERVGKGLVVNALSADGIVEGMERQNGEKERFFQLVQWHPERMKDQESAFSKNIRQRFLDACAT